jgi:hypothetical protein
MEDLGTHNYGNPENRGNSVFCPQKNPTYVYITDRAIESPE